MLIFNRGAHKLVKHTQKKNHLYLCVLYTLMQNKEVYCHLMVNYIIKKIAYFFIVVLASK